MPPFGAGVLRCGDPVIDAWNMMGGIEWDALPTVCEILGIDDVEILVQGLVAIREFHNRPRDDQ